LRDTAAVRTLLRVARCRIRWGRWPPRRGAAGAQALVGGEDRDRGVRHSRDREDQVMGGRLRVRGARWRELRTLAGDRNPATLSTGAPAASW